MVTKLDKKAGPELRVTKHPETQEGEIYYGYGDDDTFGLSPFTSKRKGDITLDQGKLVLAPDVHPIFIQRKELEKANYTIVEE